MENEMTMGTFGTIPRSLYLELYLYDTFNTDWVYTIGPLASRFVGNTDVTYERIGNKVTLFIPTITVTPKAPTGGNSLIFMVTTLPGEIASPFVQLQYITYDNSNPAVGTYVNSMVNISGISVFISKSISGADGFDAAGPDYFSNNYPRAYTYSTCIQI